MKSFIKKILQSLLGFNNYLYIFAIFTIKTLKFNRKERAFLHFLKMIPNRGIVLDVGANIGVMTVYLAKHLPDSIIVAFEPIPPNQNTLSRICNFFKLNNVVIQKYALGRESGKIKMVMPIFDEVKMQGLSHIVHESIAQPEKGDYFQVEVKKMDDVILSEFAKGNVTAIKLDVENFENYVLTGGLETIRKHHPLIYCELWDNQNRTETFKLLTKEKYQVFILQNSQLILYNPDFHNTQNFFFIPEV